MDMLIIGQTLLRDVLARLPDRLIEPEQQPVFLKRVQEASRVLEEAQAAAEQSAPEQDLQVPDEHDDGRLPQTETAGQQEDQAQADLAADNNRALEPEITESDAYADYDEELLQIFVEESGEILERSDAALTDWRESSGNTTAMEQLQRELHTLKGGARMAELSPIAELTHALETLVNAVAEGSVASSDNALQLCQSAQDQLTRQVECVRNRIPLESVIELIEEIEAAEQLNASAEEQPCIPEEQETAPVESASGAADAELLPIFLEEANDVLEQCERSLQGWRNGPDKKSTIAALQRHLHTLKGGARMAGVKPIGDLAHAVESVIIGVAEEGAARSELVFGAVESALDQAASMVNALRNDEPLESVEKLCLQLGQLRQETPANIARDAGSDSHEKAIGQNTFPKVERRAQPRESHELVRVRADLLDSLVNNAGEVSIYRARIEQQIGAFRFNLVEMDQTVARLRDQLRKLEIETEAQILFRYERELDSAAEDFDPLEMDRYSQLQQLSRSLMESVADLNSLQNLLENTTRESETLLLQQSRVNTELQEGLMRTRMVPFLGLAPRMRRIVRQTCQELGKKAELELSGAEGDLDRTVIDRIIAPIEHMLRNAISHGIEAPAERIAKGKPEGGTIRITFGRESSDVVLRIIDDGAGVDLKRVREKALERGLMRTDSEQSDNEVLQFILETGFSTANVVSQVSGRGVGMDVVNSEVRQLGGTLHIESNQGSGTTFTIRLPFTLAINQSLLVDVCENTYAIPLSSIQGIVRVERGQLLSHYEDPSLMLEYGGTDYEVRYLGELLGARRPNPNSIQAKIPMLLAKSGDHVMALQVDSLVGSREVVVKSVGPQISTVRGISGATILGDGRVVMILDIAALMRGGVSAMTQVEELFQRSAKKEAVTVMVVDDSITVRKVTGRLLERNGMRVVTAKDGVDAVAKLDDVIPDVMLLDIEMPRMDGFELATHVRNEPEIKDIPIIMITSRTGDKHRQRAIEIGVDRYLGKPFQEAELLENINALIGRKELDG
jgi:chemosensory pili system protein ChpA (sensor histidine kinase/response regulator)